MKHSMDKHAIRLLTLVVAVMLALAVTVASKHAKPLAAVPETAAQYENSHAHFWHVDWITVDNFSDLVGASSLVVRGRTIAQRNEMLRTYPYDPDLDRILTPEEAGSNYGESPLTITTIKVSEVVRRGKHILAVGSQPIIEGSIIEIEERGGLLSDGCSAEPDNCPLLKGEDEAVFFLLSKSSAKEQRKGHNVGRYVVVGGFQGRFTVRNETVHPLSEQVGGPRIFSGFEGMPVRDLIQQVQLGQRDN